MTTDEELVVLAQRGEPVADLLECRVADNVLLTAWGVPVFPSDLERGVELARTLAVEEASCSC